MTDYEGLAEKLKATAAKYPFGHARLVALAHTAAATLRSHGEEAARLERFVKSLLNPEELGHAVPGHVRNDARLALGQRCIHERLNEGGVCRACGEDCRGVQ